MRSPRQRIVNDIFQRKRDCKLLLMRLAALLILAGSIVAIPALAHSFAKRVCPGHKPRI